MQQTSTITMPRVGKDGMVSTVLFKVVGDELVAGSRAYIVQPKGRAWAVVGKPLSVDATMRAWVATSPPSPVEHEVYGPERTEVEW